MRRVAHVLRKYDPAEWGGSETHVAEIAKRLAEHGWEPEVHAPRGPRTPDSALPARVPLLRYGSFLPFAGLPSRRRALIANAGNIASLDEPVRLGRDTSLALAHVHTAGRIGGGVRTAMRWTRRPYVVSLHGPVLSDTTWLAEDTARRRAGTVDLGKPLGLVLGARRVLDDAARVVCFNDEERRALAQRIGDRAVRMDHGVDVERLGSGHAERAKARWVELGDVPVISVVGRLCEQKNQLLAVRAFARGAPADHHLLLAGATTDRGYRDRVEAEARALGIAERVHVLGNLDGASGIPDLYVRSKLVLVPSMQEAFGLIVLEAWAAGCPVVFARRSGLRDVAEALGSRDDAAVSSPEVDAWAETVRRYLADPGLREQNVTAGRHLLQQRYNWDQVTADLAALYEQVLREHPA